MTNEERRLLMEWILHIMYMLAFDAHTYPLTVREEFVHKTVDLLAELKKTDTDTPNAGDVSNP
jgi:hypothetical protein